MFTCAICGKEWSNKNYCPDCLAAVDTSLTSDEHLPDGDIIRGSFSTCAAKIRVNPLRYLWFRDETRPLLQVWLVMLTAAMAALDFGRAVSPLTADQLLSCPAP